MHIFVLFTYIVSLKTFYCVNMSLIIVDDSGPIHIIQFEKLLKQLNSRLFNYTDIG